MRMHALVHSINYNVPQFPITCVTYILDVSDWSCYYCVPGLFTVVIQNWNFIQAHYYHTSSTPSSAWTMHAMIENIYTYNTYKSLWRHACMYIIICVYGKAAPNILCLYVHLLPQTAHHACSSPHACTSTWTKDSLRIEQRIGDTWILYNISNNRAQPVLVYMYRQILKLMMVNIVRCTYSGERAGT